MDMDTYLSLCFEKINIFYNEKRRRRQTCFYVVCLFFKESIARINKIKNYIMYEIYLLVC